MSNTMKTLTQNITLPVAVLGATGKVGNQVIRALAKAGIPSRALTRNLQKAEAIPLVEWMEGDLTETGTIEKFLQHSRKLFLNSGVQGNMAAIQNQIIDVAKGIGIEQVVKLSTPAAREHSADPVGEWHWQVQEHLRSSGLTWHALQPQSFMQNWLGDFAGSVKSERKIYEAAGNGRRAFTDTRDIADVAVALFADPQKWAEPIVPLSGPALVSYYEVADALGKAIGDKVSYIDQTPEEAWARYEKKGMPEFLVKTFLAIAQNQKISAGEKLWSDSVSRILGRPGRTIADFARDYASCFV